MDNKVLGKGLSALISQNQTQGAINKETGVSLKEEVLFLDPKKILKNHLQPRDNYDEKAIEELKQSIKEKGILQPLVVRTTANGSYEVVAGQRRLLAARSLGLEKIPVLVKDVSDNELLVLALVENIQREDLNVLEEAKAFSRLGEDFKMNHEQIALAVGKSRSTVVNTVRLLKLPSKIQYEIEQQHISMGHARALLALDSAEAQLKMAELIVEQGLSVRAVEGFVKQAQTKPVKKTKAQKLKDPDVALLEDELRRILGTKVSLEDHKGRGKLVVEYYSLDDLDRVLTILRKK